MQDKLIIQLKINSLSNIKPNFSELARQYGLDRRTVKKYYDGYPGKPKHHAKSSYLDKYIELIKNKLAIRGCTVKAVYEFLLTEVDPNIGTCRCSKSILSAGCKTLRKALHDHNDKFTILKME